MNIVNIVREHRYETVCVALALILLLALWPISKLGSQARANSEDVGKLRSRVKRSLGSKDGPATPAIVEARQEYVQQVAEESKKVAELFRQKNGRKFLVDDMFPKYGAAAPWQFRKRYNEALDQLLSETLRAGWPEEDESGKGKGKSSSPMCVYARRDELNIGEWASAPEAPGEEECWFAQLDFWIQQDLAEIFSALNEASAQERGEEPSVENAAVKRIVSIYVDPYYYVGLEQQSIQTQTLPSGRVSGAPSSSGFAGLGAAPGGGGPGGFGFGGGQVPAPEASKTRVKSPEARRRARSLKQRVKPFTERFCDEQADVLHFSFAVVVDSRRINELLDALSRKNLYTVLNISFSRADLEIDDHEFAKFDRSAEIFDPYLDAKEGLVYGSDPVVMLDVNVEALFLKDIYGEYMPPAVKDILSAKGNEARQQRVARQDAVDQARKAAEKEQRRRSAEERRTSGRNRPRRTSK